MIHAINEKLAAITVKLERFDSVERVVTEMDRKIISLEVRKSDKRSRRVSRTRMRPSKNTKPRTNPRNNKS